MDAIQTLSSTHVSEFNKSNTLRFMGSIRAEQVDEKLLTLFKANTSDSSEDILLDFSRATFIEIAVLMNVLAFVHHRSINGLQTHLTYPTNKKTIDFLNVWRFPEALEAVSRLAIKQLILPEHLHKLRLPITEYRGRESTVKSLEYDLDWSGAGTSKRNFFEISTYRLNRANTDKLSMKDAATPQSESYRWTQPLIKAVLDKHFDNAKAGSDISRVIIYEAMSNAVRHPGASQIQVASKFTQKKVLDGKGHLKICIWDDGEHIASTLGKPLKKGRPIRSIRLPTEWYDKVYVEIDTVGVDPETGSIVDINRNNSKRLKVFDPANELNSSATEDHILLASLFPGFSRAASEAVPDVDSYELRPENGASTEVQYDLSAILRNAAGMGLFSLMRTAIDQFQGSLIIRSGRVLLKIEHAKVHIRKEHKTSYRCKITRYPDSMNAFSGNLITIQLPIN